MTRLIICIFMITGLMSCNPNGIFQSDTEKLIQNRTKSNEEILRQIDIFIQKHGKDGFEFQNGIVKDFSKTHKKVISFLDSLESIDRQERFKIANDFIDETFKKYSIKYPYELSLTENTPPDLIKLQIVELENVYLREWEQNVSHRFNNIAATIIPDKIGFKTNEKITGTIGWMAYSDDMKLKIKLNGKDIEVKSGKGYFSIDPKELTPEQRSIKAEIIFPDTVYATQILIDNVR